VILLRVASPEGGRASFRQFDISRKTGEDRGPLSTLGLIQYLSPSIQFLLAVLLFREPFTRSHAAAFACIWSALALLTWDLRRRLRLERAAARQTA